MYIVGSVNNFKLKKCCLQLSLLLISHMDLIHCFWTLNIFSQSVVFPKYGTITEIGLCIRMICSNHSRETNWFANMYRAYEILFSARQTFSICDFQFKLLSTIKPSNFTVSTHVLFLMSIWSLNLFRNTLILVLLLGYLISA